MACSTNELENTTIFQGEELEDYNVCSQSNVKIVKVVPLPHARSEVWSYFGFIADDDGEIHDKKKTICRICCTTLCYSGNTTNLFTHLKAMHPEVTPQKLAPTNKIPRTGKKSNKRKFDDLDAHNLVPIEIDSSNYLVRNVSFNTSSTNTVTPIVSTPPVESETALITNNTSSSSSSSTANVTTVISTTSQQTNLLKLNSSNLKQTNNSFYEPILNHDEVIVSQNDELITDAIVNLLVRDCRPIDLVTGKHFEALIKLLAPNYKMPQTDKLEQLVKKKYIEVRREMILRSMDE